MKKQRHLNTENGTSGERSRGPDLSYKYAGEGTGGEVGEMYQEKKLPENKSVLKAIRRETTARERTSGELSILGCSERFVVFLGPGQ